MLGTGAGEENEDGVPADVPPEDEDGGFPAAFLDDDVEEVEGFSVCVPFPDAEEGEGFAGVPPEDEDGDFPAAFPDDDEEQGFTGVSFTLEEERAFSCRFGLCGGGGGGRGFSCKFGFCRGGGGKGWPTGVALLVEVEEECEDLVAHVLFLSCMRRL